MNGLMKEGIIISCGRKTSTYNRGYVPQVPSNDDRYKDFVEKMAARGMAPKGNGFPWAWNGKKKPKTFLSKKPKARRRKMETIPL